MFNPDNIWKEFQPSDKIYDFYEEVNFLGQGGFGKVTKVRHKETQELRAMKMIKLRKDKSKNA